MVSFFRTFFQPPSRRDSAIVLAFTLLSGFILGAYVATLAEPSSFSLMRSAADGCVSIVSLLSALLLPFLFTAFAVYIAKPWLLIPIAFFKAFFFSYLGTEIIFLFGGSGWLLRLLLMFTDSLSMPVLCWFWVRIYSGRKVLNVRCLTTAVVILFGIVCLDYRLISPFLVNLLL